MSKIKPGTPKPKSNGKVNNPEDARIEAATKNADETLFKKISDTSEAAQTVNSENFAKGNTIEEQMNAEASANSSNGTTKKEGKVGSAPAPEATNTNDEDQEPEELEAEEVEAEEEHEDYYKGDEDAIATIVNGLVIMPLCLFFNQDYDECRINEMQKRELLRMMPDRGLGKPTWGKYALLAGGMMGENFGMTYLKRKSGAGQVNSLGMTNDQVMEKVMDIAMQMKGAIDTVTEKVNEVTTKVNSFENRFADFNKQMQELKQKLNQEEGVTND